MFKLCLFFFAATVISAFDISFKPGPFIPATEGKIWPKPQLEIELNEGYYVVLHTFFQFRPTGTNCKTLTEALERYRKIITAENRLIKQLYFPLSSCYNSSDPNFNGYLTTVDVELNGTCDDQEYPSLEMNEEYNLTISRSEKKITSGTIWGILRGLESFSQLVYLSNNYSCHRVDTVEIYDYPRFPHRGLLLDTSRHFQTKDSILRLLDAMSYNKFNVFHWHITDDFSFPYVSKKFPDLSNKGAYHPIVMVYEPSFVQTVIEYARKRGIRVIVEFDTPGHTLSWGLGNPDLLTKCYLVPVLDYGPINPTKDSTYKFMFAFYDEVKEVFKDQYTHLGGDEVDFTCWKTNPEISGFMLAHGIATYEKLQSFYTQKLIDYVTSLSLNSIVWEEVFINNVTIPKSTVVQVWINDTRMANETIAKVTAAGHPAISSAYWYLDILETGGDWLKFYNQDPHNFNGTPEQKKLVIGGEACMWAEFVNEFNLEPRVWPRASVAAEKFWSAYDTPKENILEYWPIAARLQEQSCRLNRRGIRAQPPAGPNVCF